MIHLTAQRRASRRRVFGWVLASVICMFAGLVFGQKPSGISDGATILIIRHAEKPSSGHKLSPLGQERAEKYVEFFKAYSVGTHTAHLDALFAAKDSDSSSRPRLTLEPLAKSLSVPLNADYKSKGFEHLILKLKGSEFMGKTVLICWRHGEIPEMLKEFAADPAALLPDGKWPDDVFGWLVELHLDKTGSLKSIKVIDEKLMPGDTIKPPEPVH